jgi:hypothetical protein
MFCTSLFPLLLLCSGRKKLLINVTICSQPVSQRVGTLSFPQAALLMLQGCNAWQKQVRQLPLL